MKRTSFFAILFFVLSTSAFAFESEVLPDHLTPADEITQNAGTQVSSPELGTASHSYHRPDHDDSEYRCFANNPQGWVFSAKHWSPRVAQDRAMYKCFQYPPQLCRPLGCREIDGD